MLVKPEKAFDFLEKLTKSKLLTSAAIGILSACTVFILIATGIVSTVDRPALDFMFRIGSHPERADTSVVIVAIDQKSLVYFDGQQVGWPWPREFYSILLDYLKEGGAGAVAFDMDFSQREFDRLNVDAVQSDSLFAASIARNGRVVLTAVLVDTKTSETGPLPDRFTLGTDYARLKVPGYTSAVFPMGKFRDAAGLVGAANYTIDVDGVTRRMPLVLKYKEAGLPALSLATYQIGKQLTGNIVGRFVGTVPTDHSGNYLINWYGKGGPNGVFKYYSIASLIISAAQLSQGLTPGIQPGQFRNKYVIVGGSAIGLMDFKSTPFTLYEPYPGMEIHATVLSNLLNEDYMREAPRWVSYALALILSLFTSALFFKLGKVITTSVIVLLAAGIYVLIGFISFHWFNLWLPTAAPELAIVLGFTFSGAVSYVTEGKRRREMRRVLNRYLSPRVVDEILVNPDGFELGGKEIEATIFFSDIKNFTGLSEAMSPKDLVANLNDYFTMSSEIVLSYDAMLDKYIGDSIMAVFGAPLESRSHAVNACLAAIGVQRALRNHYAAHGRADKLVFETRIGLNSGKMVVGNIGSMKRLDYTAIGDSVNLASRLEGVNKEFGTKIIISETTYGLAQAKIEARELDSLRVKGKHIPIRIYELLGIRGELTKEKARQVEMFHEALEMYRLKKWKSAEKTFKAILAEDPEDGPSRTYLQRCRSLARAGVPRDWDGVFVMKTK